MFCAKQEVNQLCVKGQLYKWSAATGFWCQSSCRTACSIQEPLCSAAFFLEPQDMWGKGVGQIIESLPMDSAD